MTDFYEIVVFAPSQQVRFHYHAPEGFPQPLRRGHLVVVPFGAQRVQGLILGSIATPEVPETRPIEQLLDPNPVLTAAQMQLAEWISDRYRASLESSLAIMLPPGLSRHAESVFRLADTAFQPDRPVAARLVRMLADRGPLRSGQIRHAFGRIIWEREADRLVRRGVLERSSVLPPPAVKPKRVRQAALAIKDRELDQAIALLRDPALPAGRKKAAARRADALSALAAESKPMDVEWVYASSGASLQDLKWLAEEGWVDLAYEEQLRDPLAGKTFTVSEPPRLNPEQAHALEAIREASAAAHPKPILLFGVTGSGKTEVYLRAVEETIARGKQAIVLVPEISLTPQTIQRFGERFAGRIGLVHSRLSTGERYDTWRRARAGLIQVILGPRSALFAPMPNIGLIVLDEEHDESYKSGQTPYFHARQTAIAYAELLGAVTVLGSATPDLTSYYAGRSERMTILRLPKRASTAGTPAPELPPVEIVDMRQELRSGNRSIFSRMLTAAMEDSLSAGRQIILFLNRRGTASAVVCRACGKSVECPRCEIPLTVHGEVLICHHCNYRRGMPVSCPQCASASIRGLGAGTRQVEEEVRKQFPGARTLRWDRDAVEETGAHDILLEHFTSRRADVLIGTQMVAKGLDLPQVTLVGMILADVGLLLPDFRSCERVFQVMMQVAGRAGRAKEPGRAVLQTYMPDHYALQFAARHDYEGFAAAELEHRRILGYPPFRRLARLVYSHHNAETAENVSRDMGARLQEHLADKKMSADDMIGPVPCFFEKTAGLYRWQIILRSSRPGDFIDRRLPDGWLLDVDPVSLL